MIKALIIEDEKHAAIHLKKLIHDGGFDIEITGFIESVKQAVKWLSLNSAPDLVFLDIQLSDGIGFEIFNQVKISCPIIFTTAYEEYALKAFKLNSIDYLLKPVNPEDLKFAVNQFKLRQVTSINNEENNLQLKVENALKLLTKQYKTRFVVNAGLHIKSIESDRINMFYSLEKATFLLDENGKSYDINYSLEQLEKLIDPQMFFKISRKHFINFNAIEDIINYSNSRLKIKIKKSPDEDIIVSRSNLKEFREWLER